MSDPIILSDGTVVYFSRSYSTEKRSFAPAVLTIGEQQKSVSDTISHLFLCPKSTKFGYTEVLSVNAENSDVQGMRIIFDNTEFPEAGWVGIPSFSDDCRVLSYLAILDSKVFVVRADTQTRDLEMIPLRLPKPFAKYQSATDLRIASANLGFRPIEGGDIEVEIGQPILDRDGAHVLSLMRIDQQTTLFKDAILVGTYNLIAQPLFLPDKRVAYIAGDGTSLFPVVGDILFEKTDFVDSLHLSPARNALMYGALRGSEMWWAVVPINEIPLLPPVE